MFRYIFALLLLNSSYRSLGVPIPTNAPVSLTNLLNALGTSCVNVFLSDQIKSQLEYCSDLSSPHGEKQLKCLIFYDINKQLCAAVGTLQLALTEDYSSKIKEEQDVNLLCESTEDWVFSNLTEFTRYKYSVEKVFKHPVTCGKICGVEDLMSDDANFFCKYFKWGTDLLKKQKIPNLSKDKLSVTSAQENVAQLPLETENIDKKPVNAGPNLPGNDLLDVQIKFSTPSNVPNVILEVAAGNNEGTVKTEAVKPKASPENNQVSEHARSNSETSEKSDLKTIDAEKPVPAAVNSLEANNQADKPAETSNPEVKNGQNNPDLSGSTLSKPGGDDSQNWEVENVVKQMKSELELKESVLETPGSKDKQPSDTNDYQDSEDVKEDVGDDDSDGPMLDDIHTIVKPDDQKSVSGITGNSVSALYPSFGQEGYSDDDDSHFFSFFLTAVIMVVLMYVLYHNKNKVGKVFFGLILEGRQAGRRRNSRGHSYRRLDTLEQAMSTSHEAAPPSKIIY